MIYSGADLIRRSGQHADRKEQLRVVENVRPVANADSATSHQQKEDTQNALLRFARFIKDETQQRKKPPKKAVGGRIPEAYRHQIQQADAGPRSGYELDIYI